MVLTLICKTVLASKIAVMGDVETKSLDYSFPVLEIIYIILIYIICIKNF